MSTPVGYTPLTRLLGESTSPVTQVDLFEVGDDVFVEASLPGIDPAKVEVQVQNGVLTIAGDQQDPWQPSGSGEGSENQQSAPQVRTHVAGIPRYGKFSFPLALPFEVEADSAKAAYHAGTLRIQFSRPEHVKPRRIAVEIQGAEQAIAAPAPAQIEADATKK